MTIAMTRVNYRTDKQHYLHEDCSSHMDCVKNIIAGAPQMDCAILVVAATDGIMPQTREHLLLARQAGINVVCFLNKTDMVDDEELLSLIEAEVRDLVQDVGLPDTPIVCGSALLALEGRAEHEDRIRQLMDAVDSRIPVPVEEGRSHSKFLAQIYMLTKEEGGRQTPIFSSYKPQIFFPTATPAGMPTATISLPDGTEMAMPGDNLRCTFTLNCPVTMGPRSRFEIREGNRIVGAGVVVDILA